MSWFVLTIAICLNAAANILIKSGMNGYRAQGILQLIRDRWFSPAIAGGVLCFVLALIAYSLVLAKTNLSVAYPLMTGLGFVIISCASAILFHEQIGLVQILGYTVIIFGVWLVSRTGA